jgi:predicted PurR-regulated permease PerM
MSETVLITLIGALVVIVPLIISFRTTSFVEMKNIVSELKELIKKYETDLQVIQLERKQEQIDYRKKVMELEEIINSMGSEIKRLERENDNYKNWMTKAIIEIKRTGGTPPPMI